MHIVFVDNGLSYWFELIRDILIINFVGMKITHFSLLPCQNMDMTAILVDLNFILCGCVKIFTWILGRDIMDLVFLQQKIKQIKVIRSFNTVIFLIQFSNLSPET